MFANTFSETLSVSINILAICHSDASGERIRDMDLCSCRRACPPYARRYDVRGGMPICGKSRFARSDSPRFSAKAKVSGYLVGEDPGMSKSVAYLYSKW